MSPNLRLERAAAGHARYLQKNEESGHIQTRGKPFFTGEDLGDRINREGYGSRKLSENIAQGHSDGIDAIDDLMTAIYHRLGFLAFDQDEIGIAEALSDGADGTFVYNMGDSELELQNFCKNPNPSLLHNGPGVYYQVCQSRVNIPPSVHYDFENHLAKLAPIVVVWPPSGGVDIPPAFYDETPDPIPDLDVTGFPISIQFNTFKVQQVKLISFRLWKVLASATSSAISTDQFEQITSVRLLSRGTDPNQKLQDNEFALFPLQRLDWGTRYRVQVQANIAGRLRSLTWDFRTRETQLPLQVVRTFTGTSHLPVVTNRSYAFYFPPSNYFSRIREVEVHKPDSIGFSYEYIDGNTIRIRITGKECDSISIRLNQQHEFSLRLASRDVVVDNASREEAFAKCGEYNADFRVDGSGEVLTMESGRLYRVHIRPTVKLPHFGRITPIQTTELQVSSQDENTLAVTARGSNCDEIHLDLGSDRSLKFLIRPKGQAGAVLTRVAARRLCPR